MSAWTPEPWYCVPTVEIVPSLSGGRSTKEFRYPIFKKDGLYGEPAEANSAADGDRICACVNACAGITNPAELRGQRDELLEACKFVMKASIVCPEDLETEVEMCRAAIARCEGVSAPPIIDVPAKQKPEDPFDAWWDARCADTSTHKTILKDAMRDAWDAGRKAVLS